MRYYLDTEFIEDGSTIDLISIGIVAEDGREYYAANLDCNLTKANEWMQINVLILLPPRLDVIWKSREEIKADIVAFIGNDNKPEFWGYMCDYDWVVLCQLFCYTGSGTMMYLPNNFPYFCCDLAQWSLQLGNPELPKQEGSEHNALEDAKWNKLVWEYLNKLSEDCVVERDYTLIHT